MEGESQNKNKRPKSQEEEDNSQNNINSQEDPYIEGDDDEEQDLMDEADVASSDSQLQVNDRSQDKEDSDSEKLQEMKEKKDQPMDEYLKKQQEIIQWIKSHPGQKWVDTEFPCSLSQFYEEPANLPDWGVVFKNLQWKRPDQIIKDPKFIITEEGKGVDIDSKHGIFGESWFIGALTIAGSKSSIIEKLVVQKEYFDKGMVCFQFFKNGQWKQVIVDTLLPYEKQQNIKSCVYSSCTNPQQFWIQLMEKAYIKLHKNYQRICRGSVIDGLVDLTGGVAEQFSLSEHQGQKIDNNAIWNTIYAYYQQKFLIGCMNQCKKRKVKNAQQGQQGILENHFYSIIDMRDFPKDNLKLIRIRNPWGNEGVWMGPFCEQADDWQKYKTVKQQLKNVVKTKKADGSWWMSLSDFLMQFDICFVGKVFPQTWQNYSVEGEWQGKKNGGKCPINIIGEKTLLEGKQIKQLPQYIQKESDDRWFNNPQFRVKVTKDTKIYISLMQEDEKINNQQYVACSFMIAMTRSRTERIWERPPEHQIIAEVNSNGQIHNQREITHLLTLKKFEGKNFGIYMIIPNIVVVDTKDASKKEQARKFYLRLFTPDSIDVSELPQTLETSVDGQWTESSAGGSRRIEVLEDEVGKKKGQYKDNPNWCKNPQYFLSLKEPTMLKIILRKAGNKRYKGWKVGMTICRFQTPENKPVQKVEKKQKNKGVNNLNRLIQLTNQYLQPPVLVDLQRKLAIKNQEKFKESIYFSEEVSALYFKYNPTEGPFIIVPSSDGQQRLFGYRLTIFSNNPVNLVRLDQTRNQVVIGKWEKDISAGGCHLNEKQKQASQRTWSMNPKYFLNFKEDGPFEEPTNLKITLAIAQKNWKKLNPNTVNGMIGIYLLEKKQGKVIYSPETVVAQTNFLPVKEIKIQVTLGLQKPYNKSGYIIMPSTYESKIQGSFIISVKCDRPFELTPFK